GRRRPPPALPILRTGHAREPAPGRRAPERPAARVALRRAGRLARALRARRGGPGGRAYRAGPRFRARPRGARQVPEAVRLRLGRQPCFRNSPTDASSLTSWYG